MRSKIKNHLMFRDGTCKNGGFYKGVPCKGPTSCWSVSVSRLYGTRTFQKQETKQKNQFLKHHPGACVVVLLFLFWRSRHCKQTNDLRQH